MLCVALVLVKFCTGNQLVRFVEPSTNPFSPMGT
ncbi:MAG: hypothetical protein RLY20_2551, partial [Verrucomicrobiota bacterium]